MTSDPKGASLAQGIITFVVSIGIILGGVLSLQLGAVVFGLLVAALSGLGTWIVIRANKNNRAKGAR